MRGQRVTTVADSYRSAKALRSAAGSTALAMWQVPQIAIQLTIGLCAFGEVLALPALSPHRADLGKAAASLCGFAGGLSVANVVTPVSHSAASAMSASTASRSPTV